MLRIRHTCQNTAGADSIMQVCRAPWRYVGLYLGDALCHWRHMTTLLLGRHSTEGRKNISVSLLKL